MKSFIISYLKIFYSNFMSFKSLPIKELDKTIWAEDTYDKLTETEKEKILSNYKEFKSN